MTAGGQDILDTAQAGPAAIRGGVLRVGGYAAGTLLAVGSAAALLRYLGVTDFGRYATVLALVTIVSGLTEAGMTSVGVREWSVREPRDRSEILRSLLGLRLVLTTVGIALATVFAAAVGYSSAMVWGTALWGTGVVVQMAALTMAIPLHSLLRFGWVSALDLIRQVATVALLLVLIAADASLLALLAVPLPAALITLGVTVAVVRGSVPLLPSFHRGRWSELLAVTLPFAVASAVGIVYVYISQIILSLVSTEEATGLFGASFRIFIVLVTVPALMVTAALPILSRAARDDANRLSYAVTRLYDVCLVLGAVSGLALVAAAPVLIDVVAGDGFDESVDVLRIHGVALLFSFLAAVGGYALVSMRLHRPLLLANAAALLLSAGGTWWLGQSIGPEGAAIANVVGEAVLAVAYGAALWRAGLRLSGGEALKVAVATAVATAPVLLLGPVAGTFAAVAVFFAVLLLVRGIPPEAGELLARLRPARG